jgi:hypothetical protein
VTKTWIDDLIPLPRPEYAKQPEALLTDLLWRSDGSTLSTGKALESLPLLRDRTDDQSLPDPERLVPQRFGSASKTFETSPLATSFNLSTVATTPPGISSPIPSLLSSLTAPRARGDKSTACVPIHPATVALQTLHGLVNKSSPANLAKAIETMGWLGGAVEQGAVARAFLNLFSVPADPRHGATGAIEALLPQLAAHVWSQLSVEYAKPQTTLPAWPTVASSAVLSRPESRLSSFPRTPFTWFWGKWKELCTPSNKWHDRLPARRFVDWALCLLRTSLAFSYLWEAEFFSRIHAAVALRRAGGTPTGNSMRVFLEESTVLATIERSTVPPSQKSVWPAIAELIAHGWKARDQILEVDGAGTLSELVPVPVAIENWVNGLTADQVSEIGAPIRTTASMANNQKEFVRYLLQPRSSDNDSVDQADFYSLARTNGKHLWFRPGPEWLVVVTSLLCRQPGGACTLGELTGDLGALGMHVERSVLVGMLEEAGLSRESPDADDALLIRSGF